MKEINYYFLLLLFLSVKTYAVDVKITKPCSEELAINSIFNTPIELEESDVISDAEMLAYRRLFPQK